jgi:hypothetical protein
MAEGCNFREPFFWAHRRIGPEEQPASGSLGNSGVRGYACAVYVMAWPCPPPQSAGSRTASRYESQNTKSPELVFSALLVENGAQKVRFERAVRS